MSNETQYSAPSNQCLQHVVKIAVVDELKEMYSDKELMKNKQLSLRALVDVINSKFTPGLKTDWKTLQAFTGKIGYE